MCKKQTNVTVSAIWSGAYGPPGAGKRVVPVQTAYEKKERETK